MYGYPRRPLDLSKPEQSLKMSPISNGERIYVNIQHNINPSISGYSANQSSKPPSYDQSLEISKIKQAQNDTGKRDLPLWIFQRKYVYALPPKFF